jgi:hypothetical protein
LNLCSARFAAAAHAALLNAWTSVHAQVSVTTYHNDPACSVSIAGGTHDVLYTADKHDSIRADADNGTVLQGATVPKDAL